MMNLAVFEELCITRIKVASATGVLGYTIRSVGSYGGQLDDDIGNIVRSFPAVWFTFGGIPRSNDMGHMTWRDEVRWAAVVATQNARNEAAARRGSGVDIGAYQLVKDVRRLLAGQTLGLDIERIALGPVVPLLTGVKTKGGAITAFGCEFTTKATVDFHADAEGAPTVIGAPQIDINPLVPGATADLTLFRPELDPPIAPIGDLETVDSKYDKPGPGNDQGDDGKLHDVTEIPE